jgi:excisionase family DNA binding protein
VFDMSLMIVTSKVPDCQYVLETLRLTEKPRALYTTITNFEEVNVVPRQIDGETYYTAAEAARYLGVSRDAFTRNVKPHLRPYKHGALRREYFRRTDLDGYRGIHPVEADKQDQD